MDCLEIKSLKFVLFISKIKDFISSIIQENISKNPTNSSISSSEFKYFMKTIFKIINAKNKLWEKKREKYLCKFELAVYNYIYLIMKNNS